MQRHADGCGDLWHKQTGSNGNQQLYDTAADKSDVSSSIMSTTGTIGIGSGKTTKPPSPPSSNDWVVIPVFTDIVRLAVLARDDCQTK